jgi:hypothetical protein
MLCESQLQYYSSLAANCQYGWQKILPEFARLCRKPLAKHAAARYNTYLENYNRKGDWKYGNFGQPAPHQLLR